MTLIPAAVAAGLLTAQLSGLGSADVAAQGSSVEDDRSAVALWCKTLYASTRLANGTFAARLMVANLGRTDLRSWSVRFRMAAGQRIAAAADADWSQQQRHVVLTAARELAPGATATMALHGTFDTAQDDVPTGFTLNGARCDTAVQVSMSPTPQAPAATQEDGALPVSTRSTPARNDQAPDLSPTDAPTPTNGSTSSAPGVPGTRPPASTSAPAATPTSRGSATPAPSPTVTGSVSGGPPENNPTGAPSTGTSHPGSAPATTTNFTAVSAPAMHLPRRRQIA